MILPAPVESFKKKKKNTTNNGRAQKLQSTESDVIGCTEREREEFTAALLTRYLGRFVCGMYAHLVSSRHTYR